MPEAPDQRDTQMIPPPLLPSPTHLLPSAPKHRPPQRRRPWQAGLAAAACAAVAAGAFGVIQTLGEGSAGDGVARGAVATVEPEGGNPAALDDPTVFPVNPRPAAGRAAGTGSTASRDRGTTVRRGPTGTSPSSSGSSTTAPPSIQPDGESPVSRRRVPSETSTPTPSETSSGPTPAPSTQADGADQERVIVLTNEKRAEAGCPAVTASAALGAAAQGHAADMAARDFFSHTSPEGLSAADRAAAQGFDGSGVSENIGVGYATADGVVAAWMLSDEHRAAILDCSRTTIGVGFDPGSVGTDGDGSWVQLLGSP